MGLPFHQSHVVAGEPQEDRSFRADQSATEDNDVGFIGEPVAHLPGHGQATDRKHALGRGFSPEDRRDNGAASLGEDQAVERDPLAA